MRGPTTTRVAHVCRAIVEGCWLAALVAVPLYFDTHAARVFESGKVWLVQSFALVALGAWAIARLLAPRAREEGSSARGVPPLLLPAFGFVLVVLLGTLTSIAPRVSWWGGTTRLDGTVTLLAYVTLFAAVAVHVRRPAQVERLVDAVVVAGTLVGLIGIAQRFGFDPAELTLDPRRTASTLALPPFLAAYVTLVLPLCVARLIEALRRAERGRSGLYALVVVVQVLALFVSQSRAAMLGVLAGLLLMGVLLLLSARPRSRARRLGWAWLGAGGSVALLIVALNATGTPLLRWLDPLRDSPLLERLARLAQTEEGTGRVRILIWDASFELFAREEPIGVPGGAPLEDSVAGIAGPDARHVFRPLLGYGQDTLFSAFAAVYPAQYAHFEARSALVDRCHNETLDRLLMNGVLGLVAWYVFVGALLTRALGYLGYVPDRRSRRRLVALSIGGSALGICIAYAAAGRTTFVPLGLPIGFLTGFCAHVAWEGIARRTVVGVARHPNRQVLGAALSSALVGHFVQMQFGFSVAATSTCFWIYAGLLAALPRVAEDDGDRRRAVLSWKLPLAVAGGVLATGFLGHSFLAETGTETLERAALGLLGWLFVCLLVFALRSSAGDAAADRVVRPWSRSTVSATLAVAATALGSIGFGTCDIPRADIRLAEGRRRAARAEWREALAAIEAAGSIQPHEDRYPLELARVHQQIAGDASLPPDVRASSLERGVQHALAACRLGPYNPDNTATLGRSYFTWGELADRAKLADARAAFERAVALSPGRVLYHELLARTLIAEGDDRAAIERLRISTDVDDRYPETWVLLADVYCALGDDEHASGAYLRAIELKVRGSDGLDLFVEPALLERRVAAFVGAGRVPELLRALELRAADEATLATVAALSRTPR